MNRRTFLEHSIKVALGGAAFPALIPAAVLGRNGSVTPNNRVVLGFIGLGNQGLANLSNPYSESYNLKAGFLGKAEVRVAAVCDVSAITRAARSPIGPDITPTPRNGAWGRTICGRSKSRPRAASTAPASTTT